MESDFQAIKEAIKARVNIVDVVSQYTRLNQKGKNWWGLCPFHADPEVTPLCEVQRDRAFCRGRLRRQVAHESQCPGRGDREIPPRDFIRFHPTAAFPDNITE